MKTITRYLSAIILTLLVIVPNAYAKKNETPPPANNGGAKVVSQKEPKDDAYITLSGKVAKIPAASKFDLDYGGKTIRVNTKAHWPDLFEKDALEILKPGDSVTVTGIVNDHFFTKKEIDALSIEHKGTKYTRTYWHEAYDITKPGFWSYYGWRGTAYDKGISLSGRVGRVIDANKFELDYGNGIIKVDAHNVSVPEKTALEAGDHVTVYGEITDHWFKDRDITADYIVRSAYFPKRN
ncbi:MAG: hypothetical protein K0R63_42 [Rickettsiales bacterium]|jgi:uncharacterized protein YdeI (BOF family)|nr:hypothetical protein [Rickettsiales bacterium]